MKLKNFIQKFKDLNQDFRKLSNNKFFVSPSIISLRETIRLIKYKKLWIVLYLF